MIEKVVHKYKLGDPAEAQADLKYWLSRSLEERIAAVEFLRRQMHGELPPLQRVVRIIKRQRPQAAEGTGEPGVTGGEATR
jgi:hypothetical protein